MQPGTDPGRQSIDDMPHHRDVGLAHIPVAQYRRKRWQRVHQLPDFVYFNHSIHVTHGIGCVSCHGRVDQMAQVYQVQPLTMGWCLGCHRDPGPNLRPRDQITSMTWKPEGDRAALAAQLEREYGTRRLTNCTTCHR